MNLKKLILLISFPFFIHNVFIMAPPVNKSTVNYSQQKTPHNAVGMSTNQGAIYFNPQTPSWNSVSTGYQAPSPVSGGQAPAPSGGGGGNTGGGGSNVQSRPSSYISPEGQQFGSVDEYNNLINDTFNQSMGYLNQNEGLLGNAKTAAEASANSDLTANTALLGTNRDQTLGTLDANGRAVQTRKEDAFAQARRLFSELSMGNRQRFGGSTSAGQAMSEIQGAELQRQFGSTGRQANEAFQKIDTARKDVESQFQTGILQLKQGQQQAMAKIQSDFTNAIMQINNLRSQTEQQKGQAKLQALQNLRAQAQAVQSQATQFEQQLTLMREQSKLQIEQYAKTTGAAGTTATNASQAFNNQTGQPISYTQLGQMSPGTTGQNLYVGSIKKSVTGRDQYGNYTYSDGTSGPGQMFQ